MLKSTIVVGVICAIAALMSAQAHAADWYMDVGVMVHHSDDTWHEVDFRDGRAPFVQKIENPIGLVEVGVRIKRVTLFAHHTTSVQMKDTGINAVGVKYRLFGGD